MIGLADAGAAENQAAGGKIRPLNMFHQAVDGDIRIIDIGEAGIDHFAEIVRRYIGRHADVGMATNIPPHNLGEVIDACLAYVDDPDITIDGLMEHIEGPDFPTGGLILGRTGIRQAYHPGAAR